MNGGKAAALACASVVCVAAQAAAAQVYVYEYAPPFDRSNESYSPAYDQPEPTVTPQPSDNPLPANEIPPYSQPPLGNRYYAPQPYTYGGGQAYIGIGGAAVLPESTRATLSGPVADSGRLNYQNGAAVMGRMGWHFNPLLTSELELGYATNDYENFSGAAGTTPVKGTAHNFIGLFNAILTPFGWTPASVPHLFPYLGGGVGFANTYAHLDSAGTATGLDAKDEVFGLAYDALAGIDFVVSRNFSLGARYQYLWANNANHATGGGETLAQGDWSAHVISAQLTYSF